MSITREGSRHACTAGRCCVARIEASITKDRTARSFIFSTRDSARFARCTRRTTACSRPRVLPRDAIAALGVSRRRKQSWNAVRTNGDASSSYPFLAGWTVDTGCAQVGIAAGSLGVHPIDTVCADRLRAPSRRVRALHARNARIADVVVSLHTMRRNVSRSTHILKGSGSTILLPVRPFTSGLRPQTKQALTMLHKHPRILTPPQRPYPPPS